MHVCCLKEIKRMVKKYARNLRPIEIEIDYEKHAVGFTNKRGKKVLLNSDFCRWLYYLHAYGSIVVFCCERGFEQKLVLYDYRKRKILSTIERFHITSGGEIIGTVRGEEYRCLVDIEKLKDYPDINTVPKVKVSGGMEIYLSENYSTPRIFLNTLSIFDRRTGNLAICLRSDADEPHMYIVYSDYIFCGYRRCNIVEKYSLITGKLILSIRVNNLRDMKYNNGRIVFGEWRETTCYDADTGRLVHTAARGVDVIFV